MCKILTLSIPNYFRSIFVSLLIRWCLFYLLKQLFPRGLHLSNWQFTTSKKKRFLVSRLSSFKKAGNTDCIYDQIIIAFFSKSSILFYCTKMYPIAFILLSPLSDLHRPKASFPHVLELSGYPPVPNPILESAETQLPSLFPRIPILALE